MTEDTNTTPRRGRKPKAASAPEQPSEKVEGVTEPVVQQEEIVFHTPTPLGVMETKVTVDDRKLSVLTQLASARIGKLNMLNIPSSNMDALEALADQIIERCKPQ